MKTPMIWDGPDDDFWREARDRGDTFRLARKRLKYKQRVYCPHDGRLIAAVVDARDVTGEDGLWLWVVGGHVGQVAEMRDNRRSGAGWATMEADEHEAQGKPHLADFRRKWAAGLLQGAQDLEKGRDVPSLGYPMHDAPNVEYDAPCWKCHRDTRVTLDQGVLRLGSVSL